MKPLGIIMFVLSLAGITYGYWAMSTEAGREAYPEMAGIIPMFITAVSSLLLFIVMLIWVIK